MALEIGSERVLKWAQPEDVCVMRLSQAHAPELAAPALPLASLELLLQTAPSLTWYPPLKSPFPALTLSTCSALNDPGSPWPLLISPHSLLSPLPSLLSYPSLNHLCDLGNAPQDGLIPSGPLLMPGMWDDSGSLLP